MSAKPVDRRSKDLAAIHASAKQLGMDDDTYRQMLDTVAGVRSARDLDELGRRKVLQHLRRAGADRRPRVQAVAHKGAPHTLESNAMVQKIEALLAELKAPWSYADAIARRMWQVERLAWVQSADRLRAIIAALDKELRKRKMLALVEASMAERGITEGELLLALPNVRRAGDAWRRNVALLAFVQCYLDDLGAP